LSLLAMSAASLVVAPSCSSTTSSTPSESVGSVSERLSTVGIATWKNDATGAYTIHHDDAGSILSITDYILPQLNSRGLTAGLGAIVNAVQTNSADQVPKLTAAAAAGHEIMSHSWTHVMQGNTQACPGVTMAGCADGLGGQKEVVDSKTWLEANLNTQVTYFMYPYDYRATDVAALVAQNYLGDRSGWGDQGTAQGVNPSNFADYNNAFETAGLDPIPDGQLNSYVDQIISAGGWGIRELHGVGDNTWGHVTQAQYTAHLDYIKSKRDAGQLWVANPTAAIKYKHVRQGDCGSPQLSGNTLTFSSPTAAACTKYHTIVSVKMSSATSTLTATQGGQALEVLNKGSGNWIINMDPTLGSVAVSTGSCTPETDAAFCTRLGKNCGSVTASDNCGASRTVSSCGTCTSPQTCGGGGTANVCGASCTPETDAAFCTRLGKNCGSVTAGDNCGATRTVSSCGTCTSPQTCGGGGTTNVCGGGGGGSCAPAYDQAHCNNTAPLYDTGSQVSKNSHNYTCANSNCRMCTSYASCEPGGSGCPWGAVWTDNGSCGGSCTPETDAAFCTRVGKNCGSVTANDNCGTSRTVSSCGTCTSPQTCGGGGTSNVCGGGGSSTCATPYSQANCLSYLQGTKVSSGGHNWTCSNGNCANCSGYASCAPGGTGCPWGTVWTDNGACN
jgi:hypothetical protein